LVERMLPKLLSPDAREELKRLVRSVGSSQTPAGVKAALAAMRDRNDARDLLPALDLPAAVVVGEDDAMVPLAEAQNMARAMPRAVLRVIPRAGHLSNLEAPAAFTDALIELLEQPA
jgi:pimeloyl-ACP methyl ester carboxylesterase